MSTTLRVNPDALRRFRLMRGYTIASLADKAGLAKNTIWRLEAGTGGVLITSVAALADALTVDISELIEQEKDVA